MGEGEGGRKKGRRGGREDKAIEIDERERERERRRRNAECREEREKAIERRWKMKRSELS